MVTTAFAGSTVDEQSAQIDPKQRRVIERALGVHGVDVRRRDALGIHRGQMHRAIAEVRDLFEHIARIRIAGELRSGRSGTPQSPAYSTELSRPRSWTIEGPIDTFRRRYDFGPNHEHVVARGF